MDIETRKIDSSLLPYLISWNDGFISKSFFLLDYDSPDNMLQNAILSLCDKSIIIIKYISIILVILMVSLI